MLRLICLLPCLVALATCRSIYDPYSLNGGVNHYHQNNYGHVTNPLTGNDQTGYYEQPWRRNVDIFRGNNQGISNQFISNLQGRNDQMTSDIQGFEDQRRSDLRSQQDQLISDLGGSNGDPRFTQQWGPENWW